jgi:hypothetical protein
MGIAAWVVGTGTPRRSPRADCRAIGDGVLAVRLDQHSAQIKLRDRRHLLGKSWSVENVSHRLGDFTTAKNGKHIEGINQYDVADL